MKFLNFVAQYNVIISHCFLPFSANLVVGDSGCEDSEDEWDFIKVDVEKKSENQQLSNLSENTNQKEEKESKTNKMSSEILNQISENIPEIKSDMESQHASEDFNEKNLVYNVLHDDNNVEKNDDEFHENSAESKLNPGAKEFIPRSPTSPVHVQNPMLLLDDPVVAQSPKPNNKDTSVTSLMENINVPTEVEFDAEISHRPHETEDVNDFINGGNGGVENLNPKEAAQSDEKLEEDYIAMSNGGGGGVHEPQSNANLITFDRFNEPEAMNESFYEEKPTCDDLNKIQTLPMMTQESAVEDNFDDNDKENCPVKEMEPEVDIISFENTQEQVTPVMEPMKENLLSVEHTDEVQITHQNEHVEFSTELLMEQKTNDEQVKLDPVPDLLNSDPDLNKIVENVEEKKSNDVEEIMRNETNVDEISNKNEINQKVTEAVEEKKPETENLLIFTSEEEPTQNKGE